MFLYIMNGFEEGRFLELKEEIVQIGRSDKLQKEGRKNDILFRYDKAISGVHARFTLKDEEYHLMDMRSSYGTFINQSKIESSTPVSAGDVINIGHTLLLVCADNTRLPEMKRAAMAV